MTVSMLANSSNTQFYVSSADGYPLNYYRYFDIRDEPWNMDNPDRNYGWHMLQGWTMGDHASNWYSFSNYPNVPLLEFRVRISATYGGADFGWDYSADSYDNPAYVEPRPYPPSGDWASYSGDTSVYNHTTVAPDGYKTMVDKRIWCAVKQSYIDANHNAISTNNGWRGTDTWTPDSQNIIGLHVDDQIQYSMFWRSLDNTWDGERELSAVQKIPPTPACWFTPAAADITAATVSITPQASSAYNVSYDYRTCKSGGTWGSWYGTTSPYNIQGMAVGDQVQFRARYYNDVNLSNNHYITADHYSSWGWGYSAVYTRASMRPANFTGFSYMYAGLAMQQVDENHYVKVLPASLWNDFTKRINEFRQYKKLAPYGFTTVYAGNMVLASIYNEAVRALEQLGVTNSSFDLAFSDTTPISARSFVYLQQQLNSIQ